MQGGYEKYDNDHGPVEKDPIISSLLPDKITECSLVGPGAGSCLSIDSIKKIASKLKTDEPIDKVIDASKNILGCATARCVVQKLDIDIGKDAANFKIKGPIDTSLLSNYNIDGVMRQYAARFPDFYPYNFNMLNYMDYSFHDGAIINEPDSLATVQFSDLHARGFRRAGCIINTDVYQGQGKHWMALFVDSTVPSVEFFNSSGNAPAPEWISYMVKTKDQLEELTRRTAQMVKVTNIRHQQSKTECGVYSLFYVWARLNKVPYSYFIDKPIPDQLMFEFRQHLFDGSPFVEFDFHDYTKKFRIQWE